MKTRIAALITAATLTTALLGAGATAAIAAGATQDTITVNAKNDPTAAAADLKLITNATDANFTPAANPVTVTNQKWTAVGNAYTNSNTGPVEAPNWVDSTSNAFGWSLGGQVSASVGASLLGLANEKLTLTFGVNHTWQTTNTHAETVTATVQPGKTVFLVKRTSTDDITGSYSFTAGGTHYDITNVTINALPSSSSDPVSDTTYELMQLANTSKAATSTGALTATPAVKDPEIVKAIAKLNAEDSASGK